MGQKTAPIIRVVLDTNVLVSSLLFSGPVSRFVPLWKNKRILPLVSKATFEELVRVLNYRKFSLSEREIEAILVHEILPYFEVVQGSQKGEYGCRDAADEKFLSCAVSGNAEWLITGDQDLLKLKPPSPLQIVTPSRFLLHSFTL